MRSQEKHQTAEIYKNSEIKLYTRRWFLLILFSYTINNVTMPWVQYASITNVVSSYYDVHPILVEWTSTMVMATRAFFLFPSLFLMDKLETKNTILLANSLCLIGSCIKLFAVAPNRFYIAMIGHVFSSLALIFTYSLIARFSSAWFSGEEISLAGSLGCVGEQMGAGFSFLFPNLFISDSTNIEEIEKGMRYLNYLYAANSLVGLLLILIFFKSKPKHPPSAAQAHKRANETQNVYKCVKKNLSNPSFLLFALSHAFVIGPASNALGTVLNEIVVTYFPGYGKHTGTLGFLCLVSGMIGSTVLGYLLDKTRKFKGNAIVLSAINCICLGLYAVTMKTHNIVYMYIIYTIIGFFMMGYYATGFQMGIELTFPVPEGITVATMSVCIELCSIVATPAYGFAVRKFGGFESTLCVAFLVFVSTVAVCLVPPKFKREELEKSAKSVEAKGLMYGSGKNPEITSTTT